MYPREEQLRALIAEDTVVGRQIVSRILTEAGFSVSTVANGLGVLDLLAGSAFDLIIMDCRMPEMDGFAATRAIRAGQVGMEHANLPIIAISGLASETDRQICRDAGMDDLVQKPVTSENLIPAVNAVLERRRGEIPAVESDEQEESRDLLQSLDDWSPGFMDSIIDQFVQDIPKDIAALRQAMQAEDLELQRELAHRLRGSADVLAATALSKRARALETACAGNNLALARQLGPALILELERLLKAHD